MGEKDVLIDLYKLLKKHSAYIITDEDYILIIHEDTNEQIQSFFYMIDTVDIGYKLLDLEVKNEEWETY